MKARFNYDLSNIRDMLQVAAVRRLVEPQDELEALSPRQRLLERVEYLTTLMTVEAERARKAQAHLNIFRVQNILRP